MLTCTEPEIRQMRDVAIRELESCIAAQDLPLRFNHVNEYLCAWYGLLPVEMTARQRTEALILRENNATIEKFDATFDANLMDWLRSDDDR
jgi:hypothetical protein